MKLNVRCRPLHGPVDAAPLATVTLLLLGFFILSSHFVSQPGVAVKLHERMLGPGAVVGSKVLTLTSEGHLYWEDQRTTFQNLPAQFAAFAATQTDPGIILRADTAASHGRVMAVVDAAMAADVNVILAAEEHGSRSTPRRASTPATGPATPSAPPSPDTEDGP